MKTLQENSADFIVVPPELHDRIAKIADVRDCDFQEAVAHVLERGLIDIDNRITNFENSDQISELSSRQLSVLKALRKGLAVKEVADSLKVSEVTVRTHILRIRQRLGCSDLLKLRIPGD
ncbi:helix-turn-helix transcriptional regulator [Luteolibacter algae]|uniref:Helix-turn-helix transcriptional regulator n=1 Tax=Luteolibacter algae TaxID=454151 RepID=A0ABW5D399_9BACT